MYNWFSILCNKTYQSKNYFPTCTEHVSNYFPALLNMCSYVKKLSKPQSTVERNQSRSAFVLPSLNADKNIQDWWPVCCFQLINLTGWISEKNYFTQRHVIILFICLRHKSRYSLVLPYNIQCSFQRTLSPSLHHVIRKRSLFDIAHLLIKSWHNCMTRITLRLHN